MKNFLTIEGCEGVGKTYHTRRLKQYCIDNRLNVLFTREPGGSEVAEKIRNIILDPANKDMTDLCEAFLRFQSRAAFAGNRYSRAETRQNGVLRPIR